MLACTTAASGGGWAAAHVPFMSVLWHMHSLRLAADLCLAPSRCVLNIKHVCFFLRSCLRACCVCIIIVSLQAACGRGH